MSLGLREVDLASHATIPHRATRPRTETTTPARIALLGTGTVGAAVLARLAGWSGTSHRARLHLVHVANSRSSIGDGRGVSPQGAHDALLASPLVGEALARGAAVEGDVHAASAMLHDHLGQRGIRIVIDATASDALAAQHADWLAQGIHVVTACKLGQGSSLTRWRAIQSARELSGAHYGDAATVGAGLPLLRTLRALRDGGDRIHGLAGVLSGSLAWLFSNYDGLRPFSAWVREARSGGYTEPDPREDLSGEDVRRKLLILARTAGYGLEANAVAVGSLLPTALSLLSRAEAIDELELLDAPLRLRYQRAHREGRRLRFVARLDAGRARIGLEALAPGDPLAQGEGCDNRVAIWSDRYRERPLVIQGPGAGAEVTAAALLDDVLDIAAPFRPFTAT